MWAVVGLGNPGKVYSGTRHNVGFSLVKTMAKNRNIRLKKRRYLSRTIVIDMAGDRILLALPQTYMNNSGQAVKRITDEAGIAPENIVIIYDDLDLSLGEIRVRKEGGAGSHKGMRSIVQNIQTTNFPRIRIGIGPLDPNIDAADFVLSSFTKEEQPIVMESLNEAQDALEMILAGSIETAMNAYNQKKIT
ncbi:MAG: aminoacyl-tRNA hydrolase [Candidatus Aminicenantes bacterium]|nr:aminoacyl-tRNA hydrolase [Candidatus Aminicenantes bacterium]